MPMPTTKAECDALGFQLEREHADLHDAQDQADQDDDRSGSRLRRRRQGCRAQEEASAGRAIGTDQGRKTAETVEKAEAAGRVALLAENRPSPGSAGLVER